MTNKDAIEGEIVLSLPSVNWAELKKKLLSDLAASDAQTHSKPPKLVFSRCDEASLVAPGWNVSNSLVFDGDLGDYCLSHFQGADVEIRRNVGHSSAQSIQSGMIIIHGHAGDALAAYGVGGLVAVYGNAGRRTASCLDGADVLVRGSVGSQAGFGMQSGSLIVGGSAGHEMGKGMTGGVIFIRGEPESVADHVREVRMREADRMRIGLILLKAGIKSSGKEFRVFRLDE